MDPSTHALSSSDDREPPGYDGFITDADWLQYRLERAHQRVDRCEIGLAAAGVDSARWLEAERLLRFAREEVEAYEEYLRETTCGSRGC